VSYLLDTNACIAIINGRPPGVRRRLRATLTLGEPVAVSSVALFELWYGVAKSAQTKAGPPWGVLTLPSSASSRR
jgi:tRNA(fMet)-specific endonuclease VapC